MTNENKIDLIKSGKLFSLSDIIILSLLVITTAILFISTFFGTSGQEVIVNNNGQISYYSLENDATIEIDSFFVIVIENNECYVLHSDCPDGVCMEMGRISKVNEIIVCVPYNITITICGDSDLSGVVT